MTRSRTSRTLGVVVEKTREVPPAFRAGVVWGAIPWLAGLHEATTWEEAVEALGQRMQSYGYDPVRMILFDSVEEAQAEGRRRLAASDLLRPLEDARAKLPEVLAGEGHDADAHDRQVLTALDNVIRAVRLVSSSSYDKDLVRDADTVTKEVSDGNG